MILGRHVTIVLIDSMQMQPINFTIAVEDLIKLKRGILKCNLMISR